MSNYKKYKPILKIRAKIIFLFLFVSGLLFTISCKPKKTFSELLKEKSDSLNLHKTPYNANYFKDTVVHYVVRANFMGGKIEIIPPVYRVPGKFFNVYEESGNFIVKLLDQSHNVISSYTTLPPHLIIAHESDNDSIVHYMGRVKFDLSFPADSNIKFIGFSYIKNSIDTTIGVPDSIAAIQ